MADIIEIKTGTKVETPPDKSAPATINKDAVEMIENCLNRLKSGESIAMALVEVRSDPKRTVNTCFTTGGDYYHEVVSGCAVLLSRVTADA